MEERRGPPRPRAPTSDQGFHHGFHAQLCAAGREDPDLSSEIE